MIGSRIKSLRQQKGISQLSLSKKLNISNTTLSQYENDKRVPSLDILKNIADILGVSVDKIIGRENPHFYLPFEKDLDDLIKTAESIDLNKNNIFLYYKTILFLFYENIDKVDDFYNILKDFENIRLEFEKVDDLRVKLNNMNKMYHKLKKENKV